MSDPRKLDERIDVALAAWPPEDPEAARPPDADATWDAAAARTLERVQLGPSTFSGFAGGAAAAARPTDDDLLAPPFPEPEEGGEEVTQSAPRPSGARLEPRSRASGEKFAGGGQKSTRDDVPSGRMEAIPPASSREARMTMSSEQRQRERTSFKDIAKLAATPPPSGTVQPASSSWGVAGAADQAPPSSKINPNDSGMVDLKLIAALDPRGADRAKSTPLAAAGLFEDEPASVRPSAPPPSFGAGPLSAPPASARISAPPPSGIAAFAPSAPSLPQPISSVPQPMIAEAVPASVAPVPAALPSVPPASVAPSAPMSARAMLGSQPTTKKKGAGLVIGLVAGVVAISAAAAGGVLYLRHKAAAQPAPVAAAVETPAPVAKADPTPAPATPDPAAAAATDDTDPNAPDEVAVDDMPLAKSSGAKPVHHHRGAKASAKPVAEAPAAPEPEKTAKSEPAPKVKFAPTGGGGDLQNAMKAAAGPLDTPQAATEEKPSGPQYAPGSVPQKPANGAVQGAIGAVLPNARACLGPDDPVSHATLTFGSSGKVQSVKISGAAAGKPEEKCIKDALGRAKVQPFAEPTFTTSFTVRP